MEDSLEEVEVLEVFLEDHIGLLALCLIDLLAPVVLVVEDIGRLLHPQDITVHLMGTGQQ